MGPAEAASSPCPAALPASSAADHALSGRPHSGGESFVGGKTEKRMDSDESKTGMYVLNRRGEREPVSFDQILHRVQSLCYGLHPLVDPARVSQAVINGMFAGIKTSELDELAAQTSAYMAASHPDFSKLAARIAIDNLHKNTSSDFAEVVEKLHSYVDAHGRDAPLIHDDVYKFVMENRTTLNAAINYQRDFDYDYFAFKTLERQGYVLDLLALSAASTTFSIKRSRSCQWPSAQSISAFSEKFVFLFLHALFLCRSYLLRVRGTIVERPQHMIMRVACGIHYGDIEKTLETYELMSLKLFTHATPTLFNAGTPRPQMSSCYLLTMQEDSIDGIFSTLRQCALISKTAGGLGLSVTDIRATGSYIRGTNGYSNGLIPMLRVFNDASRYVDQGGGKRKGSLAVYLEPWHSDIFEFLDLRKNHGKEEMRARDLFPALWIPDIFMQRVYENGPWTLMCPCECPGLTEAWGERFNELYEKYEKEGRGRKTIPAQKLWFAILQAQIETGTPYMLYKDACNRKSNQQNLGTIHSSNLCCEVVQYTSPEEVAVCNLASVSLSRFVDPDKKVFDFDKLKRIVKVMTRNLNNVIDRNYYPVPEARNSNLKHRPIGLGVQGLADAFLLLRYPFDSPEAKELNKNIFECIYYAACEASMELAAEHGILSSSLPCPPPAPHRSLLIQEIPDDLKELYKTVWEIKQKSIVDMAIDRAPFVDQSQSLNIHMTNPTYAKLSTMHFHGWQAGLKTGMYYLRTQAAADAIKFTVDQSIAKEAKRRQQQQQQDTNISPTSNNNNNSNSSSSSNNSNSSSSSGIQQAPKTTTTSAATSAAVQNTSEASSSPPAAVSTATSQPPSMGGVCRLRPKGLGDDEACAMCSG
ncbi:hypothetical protein ACSSS7_007582 [Eimeria intestinalis]